MAQSPLLQIEQLTKHFGGLVAVRDYRLRIAPGEIVGLIGPNGAGKTTIFNLISGHLRPSAGRIVFRNREITNLRADHVARLGIARTFQNIRLFPHLTVQVNVLIGAQLHRRYSALDTLLGLPSFHQGERRLASRTAEILALLGLGAVADLEVRSLPLGVQRKVEIARALALDPVILLLDEPAGGLTAAESGEVMALLRQLRDRLGLTIFLIEHDMRVVMGLCDRVQAINFGQLIAEGSPGVIREHPAVIEAYLGVDAVAER
ncbi:MAG: ABC transporter ATP-binding protein [Armatimonadota bacterium]|nr:ABC transporter ATP-binding protein [Armatimonadota bacterium]MDR7426668.1 ABC transporter ATP-binding protein [Armatimonadota bacterium]MDR7464375.1 ABC transporter ATP-binding protein [Armatimonadota bacterium]MDR7469219.1 ABC transporter ATP-binding protein [Armatimonadota bacterium]MDR7475070.1 ABC transporter ATP-binding protein [Armatimonadota bacterium]